MMVKSLTEKKSLSIQIDNYDEEKNQIIPRFYYIL